MSLPEHAQRSPDKVATVEARSGRTITFGELEQRSLKFSGLLDTLGLQSGDVVAVMMENNLHHHEIHWGTIRSGRRLTTLNVHLSSEEIAYVVSDSGAKVIVATPKMLARAEEALSLLTEQPVRLLLGGAARGWEDYLRAMTRQPVTPRPEVEMGDALNYSSGTTGRPKGVIRHTSKPWYVSDGIPAQTAWERLGVTSEDVYLCPAPLFHSAPLSATACFHSLGARVVLMDKFDPVEAFELIEREHVTVAQFVPTHFIRMLRLPEEQRKAYDLSSLRLVTHAAAPCPPQVKRAMLDWFGPIIVEYFGGTEQLGRNEITSEEWLAHPGSVGRAIWGEMHICDDEGNVVPDGTPGLVYFELDQPLFEYHNDPEKTAASRHPRRPEWATIGDMGYVDGEGYLYLTDRRAFVINSGGVNIYPQEIENVLIGHPDLEDVAVFGVPNAEMGEEVKAAVQLRPGVSASDDLAEQIIAWCRDRIAHYKAPRSIDFEVELPRTESGKLYKRLLRDRYWGDPVRKIAQ
jgi:long-chain acyl-CoA synthetase